MTDSSVLDGVDAHGEADTPGRLVDERVAAHRLGLKVATLRRWRWAGRGPKFVKLGAAVRYAPVDLDDFIAEGRRSSTSDTGPEEAAP